MHIAVPTAHRKAPLELSLVLIKPEKNPTYYPLILNTMHFPALFSTQCFTQHTVIIHISPQVCLSVSV